MEHLGDPAQAQAWCEAQREAGRSVGFVPTMGALHEGHLSLIRRSVAENDVTVVSVFVNPLQFDDAEDFERYPQTLEQDVELVQQAGGDLVFTGTLAQFFPGELDESGQLPADRLRDPGPAARGLEGEHRSGHFAGVATIVARLFRCVGPQRAYFGAKDYQQTLVVSDCRDGSELPEIVVCPTLREESGLAMSSRNRRLDEAARKHALHLVRALRACRRAWENGVREAGPLEAAMAESLAAGMAAGDLVLEYAAVRDPEAWSAHRPAGPLSGAVALLAAQVGGVRLIDNARLDQGEAP